MSSNFELRNLTLVRRIMKMLDAGYYPAYIARILGRSKSLIHYYVKKLEKRGFIEKRESLPILQLDGSYAKKNRGLITVYRVTQAGSNFLDRIERMAVGRVLRLHNVFFKYPILEQPKKKIKWRKVQLVNWTQLVGTELGMTVRKNSDSSIEITVRVIEGRNPWELLFKAREQADFLAGYLEQKFDMKLGRPHLSRKPHFGVYDPVARIFSRFFEFSTEDAKIDESEGCGEIDWLTPFTAADYLNMPSKVRKIEKDIGEMKEGMRLFSEGMLEHMKLIRELRDLVKVLEKTMSGRSRVWNSD